VLGGIISTNKNRSVNKIPILGDLPFVGQLFRSTNRQEQKTELVVFITPHVVREPGDAEPLRDYERQRLEVDPLKELDAPFAKPLDITPADLKRRRQEATQQGIPASPR
jgi:type II secretory pathway component GspD/PulD (secretin)